MKYKALILDLDGTVIASREGSLPSKRVKQAIAEAQKHLKVTIATGRPYYYSDYIFKGLNIDQPCVVDGGSQIINPQSKKIYYEKILSPAKLREIAKVCLPFGYQFIANQGDKPGIEITKVEQINQSSTKVYIGDVPNAEALKILEELEAVSGVIAHLASTWSDPETTVSMHVNHAQATKKHGVEELLKILKVKKSETIGVGDFHNDLPLLESVGFKVVMGSAPKELKAIADYIAPDLEHDGVADIIEKFILN